MFLIIHSFCPDNLIDQDLLSSRLISYRSFARRGDRALKLVADRQDDN